MIRQHRTEPDRTGEERRGKRKGSDMGRQPLPSVGPFLDLHFHRSPSLPYISASDPGGIPSAASPTFPTKATLP